MLRRVLVAAPAYLKRHPRPKSPTDLEKHPCITFGAIPTPTTWVLQCGEKKVDVRISARLSTNDMELICHGARGAIGIALLPEHICVADFRKGRLKRVLAEWCSSETPVHAVYPTARHLSPKVAAFVELLRQQFSAAASANAR